MTPYPITSFMIGGRRRDQATFLLLFGEFRTMLFPRIPSLIDSSAEGIWTEELMLKARTCFEVEAANVEMAVCMPEVFAHEELKADERFRVEVGGKVVGAKMCCPGCKSNKYVLMGGLNVHSIDKVRFAHGNNKMIMPISSEYICFNAECHDVIDKHISASDKLATLRSYKEQGITATNAKQHKKVTELTKLGVSFHGHDTRDDDAAAQGARDVQGAHLLGRAGRLRRRVCREDSQGQHEPRRARGRPRHHLQGPPARVHAGVPCLLARAALAPRGGSAAARPRAHVDLLLRGVQRGGAPEHHVQQERVCVHKTTDCERDRGELATNNMLHRGRVSPERIRY